MFEEVTAKSGHLVLKQNGQAICSAYNPQSEGEKWARQFMSLKADALIVLGVGCGYHLKELARLFQHQMIIAVDASDILLSFARANLDLPENVHLYQYRGLLELRSWSVLKRAVRLRYEVVTYYPVTRFHQQVYNEIQHFVLGRSELGFQYLCQQRDEFKHFTAPRKNGAIHLRVLPDDSALSMLDLKSLISQKIPERQWEHFFLLRTLGELIV